MGALVIMLAGGALAWVFDSKALFTAAAFVAWAWDESAP